MATELKFFAITLSILGQTENGDPTKRVEQYLTDAYTYTEVEGRVWQLVDLGKIDRPESIDIKKLQISAIKGTEESFYEIKIVYFMEDEKTTKETILVRADSMNLIHQITEALHLSDCVCDWEIIAIKKTPFLEYYPKLDVQTDLFNGVEIGRIVTVDI